MTARKGSQRSNGAVRRTATVPRSASAVQPSPAPGEMRLARPATEPARRLQERESPWRDTRWIWLGPVLTALGALLVYLRTLHPSIPTGDSGELVAAAVVLGIP